MACRDCHQRLALLNKLAENVCVCPVWRVFLLPQRGNCVLSSDFSGLKPSLARMMHPFNELTGFHFTILLKKFHILPLQYLSFINDAQVLGMVVESRR